MNQTVFFNGSESTPGAVIATIVSYQWSFSDGTETDGTAVIYSYSIPGVYYANLNVTNCFGYSNAESKRITVAGVPVGGYSLEMQGISHSISPILFLTLVAVLATGFVAVKRKPRTKQPDSRAS